MSREHSWPVMVDRLIPPLGERTLQRVPQPRLWSLPYSDVAWLTAGNAALIAAMWVRHGGIDQLVDLSGWLTAAVVAHTLLTTAGYAIGDGSSMFVETWTLLMTYPYVLMGTVALLPLIGVGIASARGARRRISYETWYGIHLYTYLAMVLGFGHQLAVGSRWVAMGRDGPA